MSLPKHKAWFPAKTHGYGWGLPRRWQGWAVMIGYLVALILGGIFITKIHLALYVVYAVAISAGFGLICTRMGERAAWRWDGVEEPATSDEDKKA